MKEFKKFISRGNVVDLAVGVIIGSAFSKIVSSIVEDILMPLIGIFLGGLDFTNLTIKFGDSIIKYGNLIQNIIDFLIIAASIFLMTKAINKIFHKKEEEKPKPPVKGNDIILLEEIRDLLKEQNKSQKSKKTDSKKKEKNTK